MNPITPLPPAPWTYERNMSLAHGYIMSQDRKTIAHIKHDDSDAIGTALAALPLFIAAARHKASRCLNCNGSGWVRNDRTPTGYSSCPHCADARAALAKAGLTP